MAQEKRLHFSYSPRRQWSRNRQAWQSGDGSYTHVPAGLLDWGDVLGRTSQLPIHGGRKELGPKLVAKIKKDLGLQ